MEIQLFINNCETEISTINFRKQKSDRQFNFLPAIVLLTDLNTYSYKAHPPRYWRLCFNWLWYGIRIAIFKE